MEDLLVKASKNYDILRTMVPMEKRKEKVCSSHELYIFCARSEEAAREKQKRNLLIFCDISFE